jgi:hypothetical protein
MVICFVLNAISNNTELMTSLKFNAKMQYTNLLHPFQKIRKYLGLNI